MAAWMEKPSLLKRTNLWTGFRWQLDADIFRPRGRNGRARHWCVCCYGSSPHTHTHLSRQHGPQTIVVGCIGRLLFRCDGLKGELHWFPQLFRQDSSFSSLSCTLASPDSFKLCSHAHQSEFCVNVFLWCDFVHNPVFSQLVSGADCPSRKNKSPLNSNWMQPPWILKRRRFDWGRIIFRVAFTRFPDWARKSPVHHTFWPRTIQEMWSFHVTSCFNDVWKVKFSWKCQC